MLRLFGFVFLLHAFVGWRLLPDLPFGAVPVAATTLWLVASAVVIPLGLYARQIRRQPLKDRLVWASMLAIGSFASLLALTLIRDVALLLCWVFGAETAVEALEYEARSPCPSLAALATLVGFVNARRARGSAGRRADRRPARRAAGLHHRADQRPPRRPDDQARATSSAIVERVNALDADMIAVTGDLVDGSVARARARTPRRSRG